MDAGWHNEFVANDVSRDGIVVPLDALLVINELNNRVISAQDGKLPPRSGFPDAPRFDVTADGVVAPLDALRIINALNGDTLPPTVSAALRTDTGRSSTDALTRDPTIRGRAIDVDTGISGVRVSVDGGPIQAVTVGPDGSFEVVPLPTDGTADGERRLRVWTLDGRSNMSSPYEFTIRLDTIAPPVPIIDLSRGSDSGAVGDRSTAFGRVTVVGTTEASAEIRVPARSLASIANTTGIFQLPGVELSAGQNAIDFVISDLAGNERAARGDFSREEGEYQDPVLFWNQVLLDSIQRDASLPPVASRNLAMVHNAVLDAVNAIEGTPSQFVSLTAPSTASLEAAVAAAAHRVLVYAYPAQIATLNATLATRLGAIPDGPSETEGVAVGQAAGNAMIALRESDGWNDFEPYSPQNAPGKWQPTAPVFAPAQLPHWATMTPFMLSSPSQFRPAAPPSLDSAAYATALNEVQALGKSDSATRTAEETQIARFWADNPGTYTPTGHWNRIANTVAAASGNSISENARLFAELNTTLADASIAAWDAKFAYDLWRPITAIREADSDGNAATQPNTEWTSLLVTPAFPEYVSGHSTYSAAAAAILAAKFGDNTTFATMSLGLPGVTRQFTSFSAAAAEAGRSRVFGGIHFEFGNQEGQALGRKVAEEVLRSFQVRADVIAPRVVVQQEADAVFRAAPTLTGTVLDNLTGVASLSYRVDAGAFAPLSFNAAGQFTLNVPLAVNGSSDGQHTVEFRAVDAAGNAGTFAYAFTLDTIAPTVSIIAPAAAATLQDGAVLRGTASGTGSALVSLRYAFNDSPLAPLPFTADGGFSQRLDLGTLAIGAHTLKVVAIDAAGGQTTSSVSVSLAAPPTLRLDKVWPADGSAELGVTIRPRVDFTRAVNPTTLNSQSLFVSDAAGNRLPATIVPSSDNTFAWLFLRDAMPGGMRMNITVDGSIISAIDGQRLDADNNGTPGGLFTSTFTTVSRTILANTSLVGVLADPGPDLKPGTPDDVEAGPDGVLMTADDIYKLPIAGAKVYLLGLEDQVVVTGADGRFNLSQVPSGTVKLVLDGLTATNEPDGIYFPEMVLDLRIDPGAVNTVMAAMEPDPARAANKKELGAYLPRLETDLLQQVNASTGATIGVNPESAPHLTAEQQQFLRIEILPGRMIGTDGQNLTGGQIGLSTVPPELVRDMLPPGVLEHTFDITVQAPGIANFTVPAPMTFPNVFNAAPGTQLNFLSFDHTTGRLVIEGTATVSADGLSVTTDPGTGITHPGWHGVTPPGGNNDNPPREPKDPCREPLVDTIFNLVSLIKDIPRLAVPLAAGLAAGTAGASLGPGGAVAGFNLGFVLVESLAGKVNFVADGIIASLETLVRGLAAGRNPSQILSDVSGDWADVATQGAASAINPYLGYGESWRQAINEAAELGQNLAELTLCGNGGSGEGPSEGEFDSSDAALEAAYRGLATHFGWAPPTAAQVSEFIATYRLNIQKGGALPSSLKMLWDVGLAAARVTDLLALTAPTDNDIVQLRDALTKLESYANAIRDYDSAVQRDLSELRSQADTLAMNGSTPSAPEPTYFVYESSRGVVRGFAADGNVQAFLGESLDVTVSLFQPGSMRFGQTNFRSAASGATGGSPVLMRQSRAVDSDGDGLPDDVEFVVGTRISSTDSDGDGLSDLRELQLGLDPTGGRGLPNGVVAGIDLPGEAREAVLIQSPTDPTRTLALVATGSYGLDVVDTTQLLSPTSIGRINLPDDIRDVAYDPALRIAVLTGGGSQLFFVDLADPTNPESLGSLTIPSSSLQRVEVRDGFAYVAGYDTIYVVDIASEALVATVATPAYAIVDIAIDGDRLALVDPRPRIYSYAIDASGLVLRDQLNLPSSAGKLFFGGGIAYVATGADFQGGFATVSFANPDDLALLSGVDNAGLMGRAIAVGGSGLAVLVGDNGGQGGNADIVNVSDPTNTSANLTRFAVPGLPQGVSVGSGLAFIAATNRGLQIMNFAGADTAGVAPTITLGSESIDRDPTTDGRQIQEGSSVAVEATVTDDVQVEFVEWLVDGVSVGRDLAYPFTLRFATPTLASGATSVSVRGRAVDIGGNSTLSAPLTFQLVPDTFPPVGVFSSPTEGAKRRNLPAISVRFDEDLDPTQLLASRIHLVALGPDNTFGTSDDVRVTNLDLSSSNGRQLVVEPTGELVAGMYRLEVEGAAIADRAGNAAQQPFVLEFTKRPTVIPIAFGELVREPLYVDDGDLLFSFQASVGQRFMLDGVTVDAPMYDWVELLSPSGLMIENRYSNFNYYDAKGNVGGLFHNAVETGTYILRFTGSRDTEVSFRMLNIDDQPKIALDTAVGGGASVVPASAFLSLTGSYINDNLRGVDELDWRLSRTVAGTRNDGDIDFNTPTWGTRSDVGLTNGSDANWEFFSVQWDGVIRVAAANTYLFLDSDDGSRLWVDRDLDGQFETSELFAGNWGRGCCGITGPSAPLAAGDYPIRIQYEEGFGDNRIALRWNPGINLDPASSTQIYRFDGQAGQAVFLDSLFAHTPGGFLSYQVFTPAGEQLFNSFTLANEGRITLPATGEYALRINGEINYWSTQPDSPYFYEFRLVTPTDGAANLTLGNPVSAAISEPGEYDVYTFQATAGDHLFFDSLGYVGNAPMGQGLLITLVGPGGAELWADSVTSDSPLIELRDTGTYQLRVFGTVDRTGDYSFALRRLSDLANSPLDTLIGDGQTLDTNRTTRLYRFSATAGQTIFFDGAPDNANANWRLLDVNGQTLFNNPVTTNWIADLPYSGDYAIALQNNSSTAESPFSFKLITPDTVTASIELGQTVTGTIAEPGEIRTYTFNASLGDVLYLDRGSRDVRLAITDSNGTTIANQFYNFESHPFVVLKAGVHTVKVESIQFGGTPSFFFSVLATADQPLKSLGGSLSQALDPGREDALYRYALTAGQTVYFDGSGTYDCSGRVALYSPALRNLGEYCFGTDFAYTPDSSGEYLLVVRGESDSPLAFAGELRLAGRGEQALPAFNELVTGDLPLIGDRTTYTFSATVGDPFRFFARTTAASVGATILGPQGDTLWSGSANSDSPFLFASRTGTYRLELTATDNNASFSFELATFRDREAITAGTVFGGTLAAGRDFQVFQWPNGVQGQELDVVAVSQSSSDASWALFAADGRLIVASSLGSTLADILLPADGAYWFVVESHNGAAAANSFQIRFDATGPSSALMSGWDSVIQGTVANGATTEFTLEGVAGRPFFFDALDVDYDGVYVTLLDPDGTAVFLNNHWATFDAGPFTLPKTGTYTLQVLGNGGGDYKLRMIDLTAAPLIADGTPLAGGDLAAHASRVYRVEMNPAERYLLDSRASTTLETTLFTPAFSLLKNDYLYPNLLLPLKTSVSGVHYLILRNISDAAVEVSASLLKVSTQPELVFDSRVTGTMNPLREADVYRFTSVPGERIYVTADSSIGCETSKAVASVDETSSSSTVCISQDIEVASNQTSDYYLYFDGGSSSNSSYAFVAHRATTSISALPARDTVISGNLAKPGDIKGYTFEASAGERLYLDVLTGTANELMFRLVLPNGETWNAGYGANESFDIWQMPVTGTYRLEVDGAGRATGNFNFRLLDLAASPDLPLDSLRLDTVPAVGESKFLKFPGVAGQRLYFDAYDSAASCPGSWALYRVSTGLFSGQSSPFLAGSFCQDQEFVVPANGDLWIRFNADSSNAGTPFHYRLVTPETTTTQLTIGETYGANFAWSTPTPLANVMGPLAITATGRIFAALGSNKILEFSPITGELVGTPIDLAGLNHWGDRQLIAAPSGHLLLSSNSNFISRFNPDTGELLIGFVPAGSGGLTTIGAMAFGPDGNLYVATGGNLQTILRYGPDGAFLDTFVAASSSPVSRISGLTFASDGSLLVTSTNTGLVYRFESGTGAYLGTLGNSAAYGAASLSGIRMLSNGDLLLGSPVDGRFIRLKSGTYDYLGDVSIGDRYDFFESFRYFVVDPSDHVFLPAYERDGNTVRVRRLGTTPFEGCLVDSVLCEPGTRREFRFHGTAGQRIHLDNLLTNQTYYYSTRSTARYELVSPTGETVSTYAPGEYYFNDKEPIFVLAQTGEYRLKVASAGDRLVDFQFRLVDASASASLTVDTPVAASLAGYESQVFRFQASGGERLWVSNPQDSSDECLIRGEVLDPFGNPFGASGCLSPGFDWKVETAGVYYIVASRFSNAISGSGPQSFQVELGDRTPLVRPLPPLGQVVADSIDRSGDSHEYTFEGTRGQRLFASLITPRGYSDGIQSAFTVISPSGAFLVGGLGGGGEYAPSDAYGGSNFEGSYHLPESGQYRLIIDPLAHFTPDYAFRIVNVSDLPELPLGIAFNGSVTMAERDDSFRFEAMKDQEFNFDSRVASDQTGFLRIIGPGNQLLMIRGFTEDFQFTAPGPGMYIVSVGSFESDSDMPYEYLVTTSALRSMANTDNALESSGTLGLAGTLSIDTAALQPIVGAAFNAWIAAGLGDSDWFGRRFAAVTFEAADLPSGYLGLTLGNRVLIDHDADGRGWRLPEGSAIANDGVGDGVGGSGYDLLTVVAHEIGHALGLDHAADSAANALMADRLAPGDARQPTTADVDALFDAWADS